MASGHVNRIQRPNTWLHRPMLQNVKKVLANPEPSTQDPERTWTLCQGMPSAAAQSAAPSTPASGSTQKKDFGCPFHQVEAVRSSTRDKNVFRIEELLAL
jgi:hypothetical protein